MDSPKFEELLLKDEDFTDLLLLDIEKVRETREPLNIGGSGRKSNSLNDLKSTKRGGPYNNVQSKVKDYIASLPAPAASGSGKRKAFKKHLSMPGQIETGHGHETPQRQCLKLEEEYHNYRRQSDHTISELKKQVWTATAMINDANNKNYELEDRIAQLNRDLHSQQYRPTPELACQPPKLVACTPQKPMGRHQKRLLEDTAGSFIQPAEEIVATVEVQVLQSAECTPESAAQTGKRNLSFNSTGDLTRRSGGTSDSGINSSAEIQVVPRAEADQDSLGEDEGARRRGPVRRRRLKKLFTRFVCCGFGGGGGGVNTSARTKAQQRLPNITYKRM